MTPPQKKPGLARRLRHTLVNSRVTTRRARKQKPQGRDDIGVISSHWHLRPFDCPSCGQGLLLESETRATVTVVRVQPDAPPFPRLSLRRKP